MYLVFFKVLVLLFFFFKQKTAYDMRISDWSSDVCSSDLVEAVTAEVAGDVGARLRAMALRACFGVDDEDIDLRAGLGELQRIAQRTRRLAGRIPSDRQVREGAGLPPCWQDDHRPPRREGNIDRKSVV